MVNSLVSAASLVAVYLHSMPGHAALGGRWTERLCCQCGWAAESSLRRRSVVQCSRIRPRGEGGHFTGWLHHPTLVLHLG